MKKLISFLGLAFIFLVSGFYLFYFYLPSTHEPEGLSLEIKTRKQVQKELGFFPIVSPSQTIFLPESQNQVALDEQQEKEALSLQAILDQEAEAARKLRRYTKPSPFRSVSKNSSQSSSQSSPQATGGSVPENFQNLGPKVIEINLSSQTFSRWENGNKIDQNLVSTGKRGHQTPTGIFSVRTKIDIAWSRKYKLYMPYWMDFSGTGYGIHELPIFRNGVREGESHLGTPVSHGCVRLGVGPAEIIYNWADVGTPVVIHY